MGNDISKLVTEKQNENSIDIDTMGTIDVLKIINDEDKKVAYAVENCLEDVARAVDGIVYGMKKGGRLIYFGAGTSGRLAILDAAECPPTFSTDPELVKGIMAGGKDAFNIAKEDIEDHKLEGVKEAEKNNITEIDSVIGLSASGQAAYVIGALEEAKSRGAFTVSITSNDKSPMDSIVDVPINAVVGPEVLMGSTRLKAGTAQKMILNMISTTTMVQLGKVYKNLMVDLNPKNRKLVERAKNIIMLATGVSYEEAERYFELSHRNSKTAIIMIETGTDYEEASRLLDEGGGFVAKAIDLRVGVLDKS